MKNSSLRNAQLNIYFSKLICAEISQMTGASNRVFHQTVNSQNSMLSKEIHDQGKKDFIFFKLSRIIFYYTTKCEWRRHFTCIDMHKNSKIQHSISLRKIDRVFENPKIQHTNGSRVLK